MDSQRFDEMIRQLGTMRFTRSRALGGLAGGAIATLASGVLGADAKNKKRRKKRRSKDRAHAQGADAGKVTICHFTSSETNPYKIITVSGNSLKAHEKHGDFAYNAEDGCCVNSDCGGDPNYCDTEADGGAQCACQKIPKDEACKGKCGQTGVSDGCGGAWDCTCCSPQVCDSANVKCVIQCGTGSCNPTTEKCCTPSSGAPVCIPFDQCCTRFDGVTTLNQCLPTTNAANQATGGVRPYVERVSGTANSVTLRFVRGTGVGNVGTQFFEYRIDGAMKTCGTPHAVVIGDWQYTGVALPAGTPDTTRTFNANQKVEVRLALGPENDFYFENTQSGWITFNVGS